MSKKQKTSIVEVIGSYGYRILMVVLLLCFTLFIPGQNVYTLDETNTLDTPSKHMSVIAPNLALYPVNSSGVDPADITAEGVIVRDSASGVDIFKRNENQLFSPASTTKLLTALVALDNYQIDDVVTIQSLPTDGQMMGLIPGEHITVENLLYGALIHSGNDAAYALADHFPGGVPSFVMAMNQKAKQLHLTASTFTNPIGYDDPNHKMTPLDLARLSQEALKNKIIAKMTAIPNITVSDTSYTYFHSLKNVNQLLGKIPGVAGLKTGWTEEAGENVVTLVERNGHKVIIVVLKSKDRFGDTEKIINWVFSNVQWVKAATL